MILQFDPTTTKVGAPSGSVGDLHAVARRCGPPAIDETCERAMFHPLWPWPAIPPHLVFEPLAWAVGAAAT
ncbi:MAG TPA: hypothetical protein PKA64_25640, partial [Myxococcota bacterium]|nr:hypothetical protein [Myxococcota bacterium]